MVASPTSEATWKDSPLCIVHSLCSQLAALEVSPARCFPGEEANGSGEMFGFLFILSPGKGTKTRLSFSVRSAGGEHSALLLCSPGPAGLGALGTRPGPLACPAAPGCSGLEPGCHLAALSAFTGPIPRRCSEAAILALVAGWSESVCAEAMGVPRRVLLCSTISTGPLGLPRGGSGLSLGLGSERSPGPALLRPAVAADLGWSAGGRG